MYFVFFGQDVSAGSSTTVQNFNFINGTRGSTGWNATETFPEVVIPVDIDLTNFYVKITTPPGVGKSWTITVRKNEVDTALTVTITDTSVSATDTTHSIHFAPGDRIAISCTPTGTPAAMGSAYWRSLGNSTASQAQVLTSEGSNPSTAAVTFPIISGGANSVGGTETVAQFIVTAPGTLSSLFAKVVTAPGAGKSWTTVVRKNGVSQAVTCSIVDANTTANDTVNSASVVVGDLICLQLTPAGTPAAAGGFGWGLAFTPTKKGDNIYGCATSAPPNSAVSYFRLINTSGNSATEAFWQSAPGACTFKNLYVSHVGAPGGATSYTWTLRKNGVDTSLTTAIAGAATANSITTDVVAQQGDLMNLSVTPSGTPVAPSTVFFGFALNFPTSGMLPILSGLRV